MEKARKCENCTHDEVCRFRNTISSEECVYFSDGYVHASYEYDDECDTYKCSNCGHFTCSELDLEDEFEEYSPPLEVTTINGEKMKIPEMWALKSPNYCKHCGAKMDGESKKMKVKIYD